MTRSDFGKRRKAAVNHYIAKLVESMMGNKSKDEEIQALVKKKISKIEGHQFLEVDPKKVDRSIQGYYCCLTPLEFRRSYLCTTNSKRRRGSRS